MQVWVCKHALPCNGVRAICCPGKLEEVQPVADLEGCRLQRHHHPHACNVVNLPRRLLSAVPAKCSFRGACGEESDIWGLGLLATTRKMPKAAEGGQGKASLAMGHSLEERGPGRLQ